MLEKLQQQDTEDTNIDELTDLPINPDGTVTLTTTPVEKTQNQSDQQVNLEVLENLMSTLPPELSQILDMVIQQFPSGLTLESLNSMMNSLTDEKISTSDFKTIKETLDTVGLLL